MSDEPQGNAAGDMASALELYAIAQSAWEDAKAAESEARSATTDARNRMADALKKVVALREKFDKSIPKEAH